MDKLELAIKEGRVLRKFRCEKCDETPGLAPYAQDPKRPLRVRWLCTRCRKHLEAIKKLQDGEEL